MQKHAPKGAAETARARLLEAAGLVFAEKGAAQASAKEIAQRAGTNAAAVNYYFGGIEGLYAAVLEDAKNRIISFEKLAATVGAAQAPEAKLRALLGLVISTLSETVPSSWTARVFAREFLAPSSAFMEATKDERERRVRLLRGVVGAVMDLPPGHTAVSYGCMCVMAPCLMLLIADRGAFMQNFPDVSLKAGETDAIADAVTAHAIGGLRAAAEAAKARAPRRDPPKRSAAKRKK